jgi:hypothetical protein
MIRPGEMRERVTVQQATTSTNSIGESLLTWATLTTVWAAINGVRFYRGTCRRPARITRDASRSAAVHRRAKAHGPVFVAWPYAADREPT